MRSSTDQLIAFYKGTARDRYGRSHADILSWDRYKLEAHHNYIQTLFPLPEEGVADAPLIDKDMMDAFRSQPELKEALNQSFAKMLWFYGFEMKNDGKIEKLQDYKEGFSHWRSRMDHNHLRISRIIRNLRILGLEGEAKAFLSALKQNDPSNVVSPRTRNFWERAAYRPLHIEPSAPDGTDEDDTRIGKAFLFAFEQQRKGNGQTEESQDE